MSKVGATVKDVPAQEFVVALAAHFKKTQKLSVPAYHDLIKTATYKELCPQDPDWYYVRAASVARKIYLRGGIGVGAFQKIYGGSKSNGSRRPHFAKAAAGIHRVILQGLTEIDLVAKKKDKKYTTHRIHTSLAHTAAAGRDGMTRAFLHVMHLDRDMSGGALSSGVWREAHAALVVVTIAQTRLPFILLTRVAVFCAA